MKAEAETGVMLAQAKEHEDPPVPGRGKEEYSPRDVGRNVALPTT